jgi:hypothetical protein
MAPPSMRSLRLCANSTTRLAIRRAASQIACVRSQGPWRPSTPVGHGGLTPPNERTSAILLTRTERVRTRDEPQRSFQPSSSLSQLASRLFLDRLHLGLDSNGSLRMLALGLVERRLRLVDGLLPAFPLLLPGGFFPRPFTIAALLLPFVGGSCLPLRRLVDRLEGSLLRFAGLRACGQLSLIFRRRPLLLELFLLWTAPRAIFTNRPLNELKLLESQKFSVPVSLRSVAFGRR